MDQLTGLLTRESFAKALQEAASENGTVTVAVLDVDQFKALNDGHGHDVGDVALKGIGAQVQAAAAGGFASRLYGDEFAIALPGVTLEAAFLRMEHLRATVSADGKGIAPSVKGYQPSISIGLANYPRDARNADDLLSRAQQALWQAKEAGRNQVALPAPEEMVLKSNYYPPAQLGRLKRLAEQRETKESVLLREALEDLLRKYDVKGDAPSRATAATAS
jgi:diguanylate cyclase (GGDEF)-like protein